MMERKAMSVDEELLKRIRSGDRDAETELLTKYKPRVRMFTASYYIPGSDREDLIQEGMIGVFRAMHSYDPSRGVRFSSFANLCIRRQIISALKSANRRKHAILNESLSMDQVLHDEEHQSFADLHDTLPDRRGLEPETMLLLQEELDALEQKGKKLLTGMEWEVWRLRAAGCSYQEIADRLDETRKTVDNAIQRAKAKLIRMMDAER